MTVEGNIYRGTGNIIKGFFMLFIGNYGNIMWKLSFTSMLFLCQQYNIP